MSENNKITITAFGDIAPGDFIINGVGVFSTSQKQGCNYLFEKVDYLFLNSDIIIGNLEDVLSKRCWEENLRHCGNPEIAKSLRDLGFDVLSLANNHTFDHGAEVFKETIDICNSAGLQICGLRSSSDYYCDPVIIERNGIKVGILAYNWIGLEREDISEFKKYVPIIDDGLVNYSLNRKKGSHISSDINMTDHNKKVHRDIKKLRDEVDLIVLFPHWGYEWTIYPPYSLTLEARSFIDTGANIIIGSHSHVPQGIERYNGGLIAYSLGNFLFDGFSRISKYGMSISIDIKGKELIDYKMNFIKRGDDFQILPVDKSEANQNTLLIDRSTNAIISNDANDILNDEKIFDIFVSQYKKQKKLNIIHLLRLIPGNLKILKPLLKKISNLFNVILLNLSGKRIRW